MSGAALLDPLASAPRPIADRFRARFIRAMATRKERERAIREYRRLFFEEQGRMIAARAHDSDLVRQAGGVSAGVFDALMPGWFDPLKQRLDTEARSIENLREMLKKVEELYPDRPNELVAEIKQHISMLQIDRGLARYNTMRLMEAGLKSEKREPTEDAARSAAGYVDRAFAIVTDVLNETIATTDKGISAIETTLARIAARDQNVKRDE